MLIDPPNVSGCPKPASSIRTISTFGAPSGAFGPGTIVQSATDWSNVRPIVPPNFLSGIGRTVRSGLNLSAASARASFSSFMPPLSIWATDLAGESASACSATQPIVAIDDSDDRRCTRFEFIAEAFLNATIDLMLGKLANHSTCSRAHDDRGEEVGEKKRPTTRPTPPPQPMPLRPMWSPVWVTLTLPSASCWTRINPQI